MAREPDPTADRLFWGRVSGLCREQAQKPRQEGRSSQVVTVFYWKTLIYIFLHSLNTNIARFGKKKKNQNTPKTSTASRLPALTLSSWLGLPLCPPLPWRLGATGLTRRFSKLGRSQEKPLDRPEGWGGVGVGADEMNGKRKKRKKKNPDDRTAHVDLLVPEAKVRSQVADHALRWGVWGQAGGRTDSTDGAGEPA